jgi:proteic killer suppression protein
VIRSFADKDTERVYRREHSRRLAGIARIAFRKLRMVDAAESVEHLADPPGNRLERLRGDREGQWSIRINDQWRVCFEWRNGDAWQVEVTDYH